MAVLELNGEKYRLTLFGPLMYSHSGWRQYLPFTGCPPGFQQRSVPRNLLEHEKAHFAWAEVAKPTEVGNNPNLAGFPNELQSCRIRHLQQFSVDTRRALPMPNNTAYKRTTTLKTTTSRISRRQLSRARKARVRLRQQNRLRIAVVRN